MYKAVVSFIQEIFETKDFIPLHEPRFFGNEKKYVNDALDSTFVSSVGEYVDRFEEMFSEFTGAKHAVATVNGTAALQVALKLAGVENGDEVITQPFTFVATCNAICYCGARPVFIDVGRETMGLSPDKLESWLSEYAEIKNGVCFNKHSGRIIRVCVPMHTFGHPVKIDLIQNICEKWSITLVEDAAESLGSYYKGRHVGTFGSLSAFSFNGNKIITTGGGGMVITDDARLAREAKHLTTTAKVPHQWEYVHDQIGYNYRLPNINAALGCAQLEQLPLFVERKRKLAEEYRKFFANSDIKFIRESENSKANYWLNTISLLDKTQRDQFLAFTNENKVMTRPAWKLMNRLPMFSGCQSGNLDNAVWLEDRLVNIPSSVVLG